MDFKKMFGKGFLGFLTFLVGYAVANPDMITGLIPEKFATMTIGGAISAIVVAIANWLKHKND